MVWCFRLVCYLSGCSVLFIIAEPYMSYLAYAGPRVYSMLYISYENMFLPEVVRKGLEFFFKKEVAFCCILVINSLRTLNNKIIHIFGLLIQPILLIGGWVVKVLCKFNDGFKLPHVTIKSAELYICSVYLIV